MGQDQVRRPVEAPVGGSVDGEEPRQRAVDRAAERARAFLARSNSPWLSAVLGVVAGLPSVDYLAAWVVIALRGFPAGTGGRIGGVSPRLQHRRDHPACHLSARSRPNAGVDPQVPHLGTGAQSPKIRGHHRGGGPTADRDRTRPTLIGASPRRACTPVGNAARKPRRTTPMARGSCTSESTWIPTNREHCGTRRCGASRS